MNLGVSVPIEAPAFAFYTLQNLLPRQKSSLIQTCRGKDDRTVRGTYSHILAVPISNLMRLSWLVLLTLAS
jgi:hypothetical protein